MINEILSNALNNYEKHRNNLDLLSDLNIIQKMLIREIEVEYKNLSALIKEKQIHQSEEEVVTVRFPSKLNTQPHNTVPPVEPVTTPLVSNQRPPVIVENNANHDTIQIIKTSSLNDKLNSVTDTTDRNSLLNKKPIFDIAKEMDLNLKYFFIHELFDNQEQLFLDSLKTINTCTSFDEALIWINENIIQKKKKNSDNEHIRSLIQLVKKRFS